MFVNKLSQNKFKEDTKKEISERLNISAIATLDKDFDIYRRYRKQSFNRVFFPQSYL